MKNNFVRGLCLTILMMLLAAPAWGIESVEFIETAEPTGPIVLQGADNRENAVLITEEYYAQELQAHIRTNQGTGKSLVTPWYKLETQQDGRFSIALWNTANEGVYLYVYNMKGDKLFSEIGYPNGEIHVGFDVVAGETLYFLLSDGEPFLDGNVKFSVCFDGYHAQQTYTEIAAEPTCTEPGLKVWPCALCFSWYQTEEIPALGHVESDPEITVLPTCMQVGTQVVKCAACGEVVSESDLPMEKHVYGQMITVSPTTCTENGRGEQRCINCNTLVNSEEIPAYGHKGGQWTTLNPATCTADGLRVQYCTGCNMTMQQETVKAFGHSAGEWQTVREAGCEQTGLKEKKCATCGAVLESETSDALGHRYTEWTVIVEATKEIEGEQQRHCIGCGDTQSQTIAKVDKFLGIF